MNQLFFNWNNRLNQFDRSNFESKSNRKQLHSTPFPVLNRFGVSGNYFLVIFTVAWILKLKKVLNAR